MYYCWYAGSPSVEEVVRTCQTGRLEQELVSKYILIEDYFMRESLSKARTLEKFMRTCQACGLAPS